MTVKTLTVSGLNVAAQVLGGTGLTSSTTNGVTTLSVSGTQASGTTFLNPTATSFSELYVDSNDRRITLGQRSSTHTGGDLAYLYTATATPMSFWTGAAERMRITATGKVGIGTATPSAYGALTVAGDVFVGPVGNGGYGRLAYSTALVSLQSNVYWNGTNNLSSLAGYSSLLDLRLDDGSIRFSTSTSVAANTVLVMTERMIINASGNVGIGTTNPGASLEVRGSATTNIGSNAAQLWLSRPNASTGFQGLSFRNGLAYDIGIYQKANSDTLFVGRWSGSGAWLDSVAIDTAGNVGIGTSSPSTLLQIVGGTTVGSNYLLSLSPATGTTAANALGRESSIQFAASFSNNWVGTDYAPRSSGAISYGAYGGTTTARSWSMKFATGDDLVGDIPAERMRLFSTGAASSATLRIGGIITNYYAGNYTAVGQEVNRHSITFSSYRDIQADTLGAKIQAINYTAYSSPNYHLVQTTDLAFYTLGVIPNTTDATTERMRITSAGYVGIGTTDPKATLHLHNATTSGESIIKFTNNNGTVTSGSTAVDGLNIGFDTTGNSTIWNYEASATVFGTNASERMRITSAGNVGIGTTDPKSTLHVSGSQSVKVSLALATATTLDASHYIITTPATGNIGYTLPSAATAANRVYMIKRLTTGTVIITPASGDSIETGAANATFSIPAQYDSYTFVSDGTSKWYII